MKTKPFSTPAPLFQLMIMYGGPNVMDGKLLPLMRKNTIDSFLLGRICCVQSSEAFAWGYA